MNIFGFLKVKEESPSYPIGSLIELLQDGVCITNLSGELIFLNRAGYLLLELSEDQDLSSYNFFNDFVLEKPAVKKIKNLIYKDGIVTNFETRLLTETGMERDMLLTVNFLKDFREQTIGFLFLFKDVTELKKMQQQLFQSQKLESVGMMASGIAHDFNNILAAIIPNAELIKIASKNHPENYKRAEIIEKSAHRASGIARKLLTFTRDQEQQKQPVNLNQIITESVDLVRSGLTDIIEIKLSLHSGLRAVMADATQLQQVIMNLIINAKDAISGNGQIKITSTNCEIDSQMLQQLDLPEGPFVKISIEDTGSGIPLEILPKIFDPFFTTKEVGKGTGLGLSMVYGIVKSHNGHIDVSSGEGKGTHFDIYLPAEDSTVGTQEPEELQPSQSRNLRFLIVDDEPYVRDILADILKFLGCKVEKASSGKEAIEMYSQKMSHINYVVVDLRMPKMDGKATIEALKKLNPEVKVLVTSGFDDRQADGWKSDNIVGFLRKPYSMKNVSKLLEKFLGIKQPM